jgi:hypothetical protein
MFEDQTVPVEDYPDYPLEDYPLEDHPVPDYPLEDYPDEMDDEREEEPEEKGLMHFHLKIVLSSKSYSVKC